MKVQIRDEFDPAKIAACGQTFRAVPVEEGLWRFVTGRDVLYLREPEKAAGEAAEDPAGLHGAGEYEASCGEETWPRVWARASAGTMPTQRPSAKRAAASASCGRIPGRPS